MKLLFLEGRVFGKQLQNKITYLKRLLEYDDIKMYDIFIKEKINIIFTSGVNFYKFEINHTDFMNTEASVLRDYIKANILEG